jgi:hypothetical protein
MSHVSISYLLLVFLANTEAHEASHVARNSQPSDRVWAGSAQQQSFFKKVLPFSKNHTRGPWVFTYEPLNFRENMFVVHDFIYEPLNFRENMFSIYYFPKKDLKLRNNLPKIPTA